MLTLIGPQWLCSQKLPCWWPTEISRTHNVRIGNPQIVSLPALDGLSKTNMPQPSRRLFSCSVILQPRRAIICRAQVELRRDLNAEDARSLSEGTPSEG